MHALKRTSRILLTHFIEMHLLHSATENYVEHVVEMLQSISNRIDVTIHLDAIEKVSSHIDKRRCCNVYFRLKRHNFGT